LCIQHFSRRARASSKRSVSLSTENDSLRFVFSFEALQLLGYLWQLLVCVRGMSLLRLSFQPRASGGVAVREDQMVSVNKAQRTLAGFASTLSPPAVEI